MSDAPQFVSPLIAGLQTLLKCEEGMAALEALYEAEEKHILRELTNATDEKELWKLVGRAKALKKFRHLPEETIDRFVQERQQEKTK